MPHLSIPTFIKVFPAVNHFPLNTTQEVVVGAENVTVLPLKLFKGADVGNIPVGLVPLFGGEQQNITEQQQKYIY